MSIFLIKTLQLLLALAILVFIHELGHFLFARLFKIRVDKFYLFFDPWFSVLKYKSPKSNTEYGIGWLPLGGYCKIAGMVDESMDTDGLSSPPKPWEFRSKPAWQRLLVMVGGVLFNVILAAVIYTAIAFHWGEEKIPLSHIGDNLSYSSVGHKMGLKDGDLPTLVDGEELKYFDEKLLPTIVNGKSLTVNRKGQVESLEIPADLMQAIIASDSSLFSLHLPAVVLQTIQGSEAAKAGLMPNDKLVGINDFRSNDLADIVAQIQHARGDSAVLHIYREGQEITLKSYVDANNGLGVSFQPPAQVFGAERITYTLMESVPAGLHRAGDKLSSYVSSLKFVATKEGAKKLGGLGTIGSLFPSEFDWFSFWNLTAFLSIILAVMNILPIPGLDGGHIVILLYEMVTRKKLPVKVQERIQLAGLMLLLLLMLYANINDIFRFLF